MKMKLTRIAKRAAYTIGRLEVDGDYFCDTLEDTDRGLSKTMPVSYLETKKVKGATAIPTGTYAVTISLTSAKFSTYWQYAFCKGHLPRILGVPAFEGVLIHIGNTPQDTEGCILVGRNTVKGRVTGSTDTFRSLYDRIKAADDRLENISITIV